MPLVSGAIASLATGTYLVTRRAASTYVDGVATPGAETTFNTVAVAVPVSGRELQRLPEGMRSREVMRIFTEDELRTVQPGSDPDLVSIDGYLFEVQAVSRWVAGGYYEAFAVKVGSA